MFSKRQPAPARGVVTVRAEGLGKRYRKPAADGYAGDRQVGDWFWALRDVSFDVRQGDILGIIGRNGSGKSTLLKILSGITPPTTGRAEITGRLGSVLEVGTGFHPDLTGRENIHLAGTLLGIDRREVRQKLDEIIDFSGIGQFIDTPVKRYSSGMYVRLAYSVSALLRSDILLLDEVLSVGDAEFQMKTRSHVEQIARDGRTVLFVSHNMESVQKFCTWCLWLDEGRVKQFGAVGDTTARYLDEVTGLDSVGADLGSAPAFVDLTNGRSFFGTREMPVLTSLATIGANATPTRVFRAGDPLTVEIGYRASAADGASGYFTVFFLRRNDERAMVVQSSHDDAVLHLRGEGIIACQIPELRLAPGVYSIMVDYGNVDFDRFISRDCIVEATRIRVDEGGFLGLRAPVDDPGEFLLPSQWTVAPA